MVGGRLFSSSFAALNSGITYPYVFVCSWARLRNTFPVLFPRCLSGCRKVFWGPQIFRSFAVYHRCSPQRRSRLPPFPSSPQANNNNTSWLFLLARYACMFAEHVLVTSRETQTHESRIFGQLDLKPSSHATFRLFTSRLANAVTRWAPSSGR